MAPLALVVFDRIRDLATDVLYSHAPVQHRVEREEEENPDAHPYQDAPAESLYVEQRKGRDRGKPAYDDNGSDYRGDDPARSCRGLLRTLMEWMGHRELSTTLVYADFAPSTREADLLDLAFAADARTKSRTKTSDTEEHSPTPEAA
jgi:hypothetical protein